jgi:hypothetical protein
VPSENGVGNAANPAGAAADRVQLLQQLHPLDLGADPQQLDAECAQFLISR